MKCPKCKTPVEKEDLFCPACGNRLDQQPASKMPVIMISSIIIIVIVTAITIWLFYGNDIEEKGTDKETSKVTQSKSKDLPEDASKGDTQAKGNEPEHEEIEEIYDVTEGGIHRYEYVISDCTWEEAYQACISKGGYLVRINSDAEYAHILNEIEKNQMKEIHFSIGGRRDMESHDYYWVDKQNQLYGEKINSDSYWCANQWMKNEPSFEDKGSQENCLDIFYYEDEGRWVWNDVPNDILQAVPYYSGKLGYICEYED